MAIISTRLLSTGTLLVNGQFDETTYTLNKVTTDTVYTSKVDEVSLAAGAISFSGSGQYLSVAANSAFAFGTNPLTIEAWCYFIDGTANSLRVIYSNYSVGWTTDCIYFGKHTAASGKVTLWLSNYSSATPLLTDPTVPPDNTWIHYAVTRSGNTWTLYRNGTSVASATYSGDPNATRTNVVIGEADVNSNYMYGYLSNIRIVTGTAVYTGNFTPSQSILDSVPATSLLLNVLDSTNYIKDNSPNNFSVTNTGPATFTSNGPFNGNNTTVKQRQLSTGDWLVGGYFDEFTGASVVDSSLILWLDAGQSSSYSGSGSSWNDLSSSGKNFTLYSNGLTTPTAGGLTYSTLGGGSLLFSSSQGQYAEAASFTSKPVFTVEAWANFTALSGTGDNLITEVFPGSTGQINFNIGHNYAVGNYYGGFFNGSWRTAGNYSPSLNTWYHFSTTYDGSTISFYVNGLLSASASYSGTPTSSGAGISIGRRWDTYSSQVSYVDAYISVIKIYNRSLTADEVAQNFNSLRRRYGI